LVAILFCLGVRNALKRGVRIQQSTVEAIPDRERFLGSVSVVNDGFTNARLLGVQSSCGVRILSPLPVTLGPGEATTVSFVFATSTASIGDQQLIVYHTGGVAGPVSIRIAIPTEAPVTEESPSGELVPIPVKQGN
jgi:hypothetical protein